MSNAGGAPPRLLLLSMYALDRQDSGPTVRIRNMRDALAGVTRLEVIAGYRRTRFAQLARYAMSGRLRRLDGIYVESSTFLPSPADVAFLALARSLGIPVLTFLRDAYQLFPDYYAASSLKRQVARGLFMPAFRALMAASTRLAFPSRGLAAVFGHGHDGLLLPPGDENAFEAALTRWFQDQEFRSELRARALARRAVLSTWDRSTEDLRRVLASLRP